MKPVDITLDEVPGGVELAFYEPDADEHFTAVALRDEDARRLIDILTRALQGCQTSCPVGPGCRGCPG